jgi:hypothetical protein
MTSLQIRTHAALLPLAVASLLATSAPALASGDPGFLDLCPLEAGGGRHCDVKIRTGPDGRLSYDSAPVGGYAPADIQSAYGLTATGGGGKIVALYGGNSDYPNAEADLGVYRTQYGLPACTAANGCFIKIDEHGGTNYPAAGTSEVEQALDMEMASASCPGCKIMLIEGGDLDVALATVISSGVSAFSFSVLLGFGTATATECQNLGFNDLSGLLITGALGDTAYPGARDYTPATCQGALAVGGTTLKKDTSARGWSETTWGASGSSGGTGSGCSPYVAKPSWQTDTGCSMRMESDVSAVADPNTGVSFYCTLGAGGWGVVGGTSAASPLVSGALTSLGIANGHFTPAWVWQNADNFYDVTTGTNGPCASDPSYFCTAGPGYDGPTGWGTPNGSLLKTVIPPGGDADAGASCVTPAGSYTKSCLGCAAGLRTTGCVLTCESCAEVDGTPNPGPTLALPCAGTVANDDGVLVCDVTPAPDGGSDAGIDASLGSSSGDAGEVAVDSGAAPPPLLFDAGLPVDDDGGPALVAATASAGSAGCGCAVAGAKEAPLSIGVAGAFAIAFGWRRRRARRARKG